MNNNFYATAVSFLILEINFGFMKLKQQLYTTTFCVDSCGPCRCDMRGEMLKLGPEKINKWYLEFAGENVSTNVYYFTYFMPDRLSLGPYP